jgi:hypothetical protein
MRNTLSHLARTKLFLWATTQEYVPAGERPAKKHKAGCLSCCRSSWHALGAENVPLRVWLVSFVRQRTLVHAIDRGRGRLLHCNCAGLAPSLVSGRRLSNCRHVQQSRMTIVIADVMHVVHGDALLGRGGELVRRRHEGI